MQRYEEVLKKLNEQGLERSLTVREDMDRLVNLSSNDYLGLLSNHLLGQEFQAQLAKHPEWLCFGAGSSRLLTGNSHLYEATEVFIAQLYKADKALFFNSGYHANAGILSALTQKGDLILSDKLCHASMIDGIRLSAASHVRYPHNDMDFVEAYLKKERHRYEQVFIVTESVFSMDGDCADLQRLVELKQQYDAMLYIDEAHAVGVLGKHGLGACEQAGILNQVDVLIGTMGKALASVGAFAVLTSVLHKVLMNRARTLLFTTALPPINMAWSKFVFERLASFSKERNYLSELCEVINKGLADSGLSAGSSHIVPVMVGDNETAVHLATQLQKRGYLVHAIRPPTVPPNTARLRLSLTTGLTKAESSEFIGVLSELLTKQGAV